MGDIAQALDKLLDMQREWAERKSDVWGISTGFPSIDRITGGFHDGEIFVMGARTSQGKTALGTQMLFSVVEQIALESVDVGETTGQVIVFSPEMSGHMLMLRHSSVMSMVPSMKIRRGQATPEELEAWHLSLEILRSLDPYVTMKTAGDLSARDIVTLVETRHAMGTPIKLVVVDYLQYLTNSVGRDNSYEQVSGVTKELKDLANQMNVPILVLSQMNRRAAQKADDEDEDVPELHELEGSGKIEARADTVGLLWRPIRIQEDEYAPQKALVRIGKNRNGPVGIIPLWYYPAFTRFVDPEDHDHASLFQT